MPRSPSRDLSDRFTGNRAYFVRSEWMRRGRYLLAGMALLGAVVWSAMDVTAPALVVYSHSHGPLTGPHAMWDRDCAVCHREHSAGEFGLRSLFNARDRWHDLTCEKCHAGPLHSANLTTSGRDFHDRCSNCHHDHNGRANSLVHIADTLCTGCHADLGANHVTGSLNCANTVTDFVAKHPEFRPLTKPPERTLKFSHAVHLTPGQVLLPGGKEAMSLGKLTQLSGPAAAGRYRRPGQVDGDLVSLDCASCHRLDAGAGTAEFDRLKVALDASGTPTRSVLPQRTSGAYFLPVTFEVHCQACHPLRAGERGEKRLIAGFDVPHRLPADKLEEYLLTGYLRRMLADDRPELAQPAEPGGALQPRPSVGAGTFRDEASRFAKSELSNLLNGRCAECHDAAGGKVAPVADRTVWFRAARFDHTVHRATHCATCHPGTQAAFASPGTTLVEKEPVQILGVDSCRACHSPAGTRVTQPDGTIVTGGGVRHHCTDCHRYHDADHGMQGRGSQSRFPNRQLSLLEFLRGR